MPQTADQRRADYQARKTRAEAMRATHAPFAPEPESRLLHADELREFAAWRRKGQEFGAAHKPRADFNIREERMIVRKVSSGHVITYRRMGNFRGLFSDHY